VGDRFVRAVALVVLAALVAAGCASTGRAPTATGTSSSPGLPPVRLVGSTYQVPNPLPAAAPGTLIALTRTGPDPSVDAAARWVFLYHSTDVKGRDVAVSGQLVVPRGSAPAGGWPVVSWAHGTSGIADRCTPSERDFWDHENAQEVRTFVDAGYAVAATDYEGLGTPGTHSYLVGADEGDAVVDVVSAAHHVTHDLSPTWFAVGHSQGGQAVLFATRSARRAPALHLAATVALAPASSLNAILPAVISLGDLSDQAYAIFSLIGLSTFDPTIDLHRILGAPALTRLPIALQTGCIDEADAAFRQVPTAQLFHLSAAELTKLDDELERYDEPEAEPTVGPVLLVQGLTDQDVPAGATAALLARLRQQGSAVTERTYPGLNHDGVVGPSECAQLAWLAAHGGRPVAHCTPHPTDLS
jgi:alpha-beta hydrolase superfamily lysophospholipase